MPPRNSRPSQSTTSTFTGIAFNFPSTLHWSSGNSCNLLTCTLKLSPTNLLNKDRKKRNRVVSGHSNCSELHMQKNFAEESVSYRYINTVTATMIIPQI